jgi:DNA (cytosine-5)-methyltransferase 1
VHSQTINNRWCGGEQNRTRTFSFGFRDDVEHRRPIVEMVAFESMDSVPAVLASGGTRETPVKLGGSGKVKKTANLSGDKSSGYLKRAIAAQGMPTDFLEDSPFTLVGKIRLVGNGVPLPMGRAVARAVISALSPEVGRAALAAMQGAP